MTGENFTMLHATVEGDLHNYLDSNNWPSLGLFGKGKWGDLESIVGEEVNIIKYTVKIL